MTYTNQTAFTTAVLALLDQNARSWDDDLKVCAYRGHTDRKCGIGWLIADEEYDQDMECIPVCSIILPPSLRSVSMSLLTKIQIIHDECDPSGWPDRFKALATEFDLEYPE